MGKLCLCKNDRKIIERSMPRETRKLYKSGEPVSVMIVRNRPLKKYGVIINMQISKNGMFVGSDMPFSDGLVVNDIIGYFLHGEQGKTDYYLGKPCVSNGDFAVFFS